VERGWRFEALLITEHGKPHQKLIGIVAPLAIVQIDKARQDKLLRA